jgi:hypothetical protein
MASEIEIFTAAVASIGAVGTLVSGAARLIEIRRDSGAVRVRSNLIYVRQLGTGTMPAHIQISAICGRRPVTVTGAGIQFRWAGSLATTTRKIELTEGKQTEFLFPVQEAASLLEQNPFFERPVFAYVEANGHRVRTRLSVVEVLTITGQVPKGITWRIGVLVARMPLPGAKARRQRLAALWTTLSGADGDSSADSAAGEAGVR